MRRPSAGFTLLELMLVILLLGLIATGTLLSLQWDRGRAQLEREVDILLARLQLAREEAVLGGQELGLWLEAGDYGFVRLEAQDGQLRWQPLQHPALTDHQLPEALSLSLELDGLAIDTASGRLTQPDPEQPETRVPQVLIFSSGELTPFRLLLEDEDDAELQAGLSGQASGRLGRLEMDP